MKKEYLDLLGKLIRCKPVTKDISQVNQAVECMADFLEKKGIRVVREAMDGRWILYASNLPGGKVTDYLMNAHLDVVPLSTTDQGEPVVKNGLLYGRGAGDCLGQAVCMAQILAENPSSSLAAIFSTDEEIGGDSTAEMLSRGYEATKGVVVLDSWEENSIVVGEKGMMDVQITAHGKGGHAAYPWLAVNAVDLLMSGYERLRNEWNQPTEENQWVDSISATGISCNSTAHNVIPDTATLCCNIRFINPGDEEKIVARIRQITGLEDVKTIHSCVPVFCDENASFVRRVQKMTEEEYGSPISLLKICGATDARHFAEKYPRLPIVISGFRHGNIHQAGEWADLKDEEKLVHLYSRVFSAKN